ncbi:hypothetical protein [Azomonas macrocytogenes]|uniref:Uncharacterized protein n=1 Tax=Azomonas macrocytogenes TaxID=69962 RepID=A0A839T5K3_AZOMA|nr:hypothetical protein [Azomonas macrocytogenes]MBB3102963.1 hypothetical protein [Azomonas macrocytogenes]
MAASINAFVIMGVVGCVTPNVAQAICQLGNVTAIRGDTRPSPHANARIGDGAPDTGASLGCV